MRPMKTETRELKWYSIMPLFGSLFSDDNVVQGFDSKDALEKLIGKKVKRAIRNNDHADYSVCLGDKEGRIYGDARKKVFYAVIK